MYTGTELENTKTSPTQAKSTCKWVFKEVYQHLFLSCSCSTFKNQSLILYCLLFWGICSLAKKNRLCSGCDNVFNKHDQKLTLRKH